MLFLNNNNLYFKSFIQALQEQQAQDRLKARLKRKDPLSVIKQPSLEELKTKTFSNYRSSKSYTLNLIEGDQKYNENDEVHDPLDEQKPGGVSYSVYE